VSTTVLSNKPAGLITASANGQKEHEELQLIMKTLNTEVADETTLLIPGIKGNINDNGQLTDKKTEKDFMKFIDAFKKLTKLAIT
jgi:chromate reductase